MIAAVDNADDFLNLLDHADAALLDVRMPPTSTNEGLKAAQVARQRRPGFPVLVLSSYVEDRYAVQLLAEGTGSPGYLLKERVGKVAEFTEALRRVAAGGTVMDPEVISQLLSRRRADDPIQSLIPREREVLGLMAEGLDNTSITGKFFVSETAVSKHIGNIFAKLVLLTSDSGHRRVVAVLAYLRTRAARPLCHAHGAGPRRPCDAARSSGGKTRIWRRSTDNNSSGTHGQPSVAPKALDLAATVDSAEPRELNSLLVLCHSHPVN